MKKKNKAKRTVKKSVNKAFDIPSDLEWNILEATNAMNQSIMLQSILIDVKREEACVHDLEYATDELSRVINTLRALIVRLQCEA